MPRSVGLVCFEISTDSLLSPAYAHRRVCSEEELQRALQLSKEEEERRIKELEAKNQNALFDDDWNLISNAPNQYAQPQQTGWGDPSAMYMQQQYTSYNPYFFQQQQMQAQQEAEYQRQVSLIAAVLISVCLHDG